MNFVLAEFFFATHFIQVYDLNAVRQKLPRRAKDVKLELDSDFGDTPPPPTTPTPTPSLTPSSLAAPGTLTTTPSLTPPVATPSGRGRGRGRGRRPKITTPLDPDEAARLAVIPRFSLSILIVLLLYFNI